MKKYEQIANKIKDCINLKVLKDGERLPSIRSMAKQAGVSNMTVLEAYRRLEDLGLIESRPQSGFYVCPKAYRIPRLKIQLSEINKSDIVLRTEAVKIPEAVQRHITQILRNDVIPLGSGLPHPDYFPDKELSNHLARIARNYPKVINQYHIESGHKSLLEMISKLMIEADCVTPENELVVTNSLTQALMLALKTVTLPGDTVAVESPGHNAFFSLLEFFNLNAVEIPSDPQKGLDIDSLKTALHNGIRPSCLLLSSNFSNPTGALMPDDNKKALINLCFQFNIPIIEDDTLGELTFNSYRPRPLKALAPDIVLYIGSFNKILAPGYGVTWLAGGRYTDDIRRCYKTLLVALPIVTQLALASFLKNGGFKRHLRRLRKQYENNVRLLQTNIIQHFPDGTRTSNPQGGQFIWVELPQGYDAVELSIAASKNRISVAPGILFSSRQHYRKNLRLNCAIKWSEEIVNAIKRLGELSIKAKIP